jgi:hypothetical protein
VVLPTLPELLRRLAEALSLDLIVTDEGPLVIDVNPRLVEPMNALLAGVDLVRLMLALASGAHPQAAAAGRSGVRSRQLLLTVLGVANRERAAPSSLRSRKRSAGTASMPARSRFLTQLKGDPLAAPPVTIAMVSTLAMPSLRRPFYASATGSYALTLQAWAAIGKASEAA